MYCKIVGGGGLACGPSPSFVILTRGTAQYSEVMKSSVMWALSEIHTISSWFQFLRGNVKTDSMKFDFGQKIDVMVDLHSMKFFLDK